MKTLSVYHILFFFCAFVFNSTYTYFPNRSVCNKCYKPKKLFQTNTPCLRTAGSFIGQAIHDAFLLNKNLISTESFMVIAATLPVYLLARQADEPLQCHFFTHNGHRNINQMPDWCRNLARFGVGIPVILFGSALFRDCDPEWKEAAWMLLIGLPFVIFGKDIIKKFDADFCLRPWHEDFCKDHTRSSGGFPSGHMAKATYITTIYGMRFGHMMAIPLAFFASAVGIIFINCNRHYFSQIVAGAALGVMYGIAANKVIDSKLAQDVNIGFCFDRYGPALKACYRF